MRYRFEQPPSSVVYCEEFSGHLGHWTSPTLMKLVNMNNHRPLKQNGYSLLQHTKHRAVWYSLLARPSDLIYGTMDGLFSELHHGLDTGMSIKSDTLLYFGYFSTQS